MIGLLSLVWLASCGVAPDYGLTVTIEEGVSGTPDAGRHIFKEFSTVTYEYIPDNPLHTVEVMLNNQTRREAVGSFIMFGDAYDLNARLIDIRGTWKITMTYNDVTFGKLEFRMTISGPDLLSGTFTDDRGYNGTWTAQANSLVLTYYDWGFYILRSRVYSMGSEPGVFSGENLIGNWTAVRVQ